MKKSVLTSFTLALLMPVVVLADSVRFDNPAPVSSAYSKTTQIPGVPELGPSAGIAPLAISIVPPVQVPSEDWDIYGVRLNIFVGAHRDVAFIDVGVLGNIVYGNLSGVQLAGIYNRIGNSDGAIEGACIMNDVRHDFCGVQLALCNRVSGDMEGLQAGLINLTQDGAGLQMGAFNRAERFSGLQIGIANYAYQLNGLQIGVFNVIEDSNIPFMPLINAAF